MSYSDLQDPRMPPFTITVPDEVYTDTRSLAGTPIVTMLVMITCLMMPSSD